MDVAAVFLRMLQLPVIRDRLNAAAGAILSAPTRLRLAALVFLHDIGKLQPGFQAKGWPSGLWSGPRLGHVEQGYAFFRLASRWADHPFHATLTQIIGWGDVVESLLEVRNSPRRLHGSPHDRGRQGAGLDRPVRLVQSGSGTLDTDDVAQAIATRWTRDPRVGDSAAGRMAPRRRLRCEKGDR